MPSKPAYLANIKDFLNYYFVYFISYKLIYFGTGYG